MRIDIQAPHFSVTEALRNHIERRLCFALSFSEEQVHRVDIRLSDINGPRGGADRCCRLRVVLRGVPDVVVEDVELDLYVAIDRVANRAGRTVRRRLTRRRDRARVAVPFERESIEA